MEEVVKAVMNEMRSFLLMVVITSVKYDRTSATDRMYFVGYM
jgi:hypothetical protein